jgi:hypothetical protein
LPARSPLRLSAQARIDDELRALEELARRRVRAVGRCPACTRRVELDDEWLRVGDHPFHRDCADDEPATDLVPAPRRRSIG